MVERISVPRRPFDFEDYVDVLRRNVRWVIGPAFLGLVVATIVAFLIDDTYVSRALIRIVPPQVPETFVQTAVNQQLGDRINAMAQTIESRNSLQGIITTYGLYKKQLKRLPFDDVVNMMQKDIKIQPSESITSVNGRNLPAFQVFFTYNDRHLAQKVCAELVSRFLNENAKTRIESAIATNQFLSDEYDKARSDLEAIENKLAQFRMKNSGHLPDEMQMNLSQMNTLENRLTGLNDSLSRAAQEKLVLESQLQIAKDRLAALHDATHDAVIRDARLDELDKQIVEVSGKLSSLEDRYTPSYPDVVTAKSDLARLKSQREQLLKEMASRKPDNRLAPVRPSKERMDLEAVIEQIETHLRAKDLEATSLSKEVSDVNSAMKQYQARVQNLPASEREYNELLRDRELGKHRYEELQMKRNSSAISVEMENRKQGETLEVLDQASLPDSPTAPKRKLIIALGVLAGAFFGFVVVAIREVRDTSLKNLKDARLYTQLPILGSVPLLENDLVVQRRRQFMLLGWTAATIAGLVCMAASVAHYYLSKV
jgi:polysaccharide chain length determinant protein (PEP-CTERM system associated)